MEAGAEDNARLMSFFEEARFEAFGVLAELIPCVSTIYTRCEAEKIVLGVGEEATHERRAICTELN